MAVSHQSSAISKDGVLAPKPVACNNTQKHAETPKQIPPMTLTARQHAHSALIRKNTQADLRNARKS